VLARLSPTRAQVEQLFDVRRVAAALDDFCAEAIERANRRPAPAVSRVA
jgi:hypothetical protein